MKDALLLLFALVMAGGAGTMAWEMQELRYADIRSVMRTSAADSASMRSTAKTLRSQCPARPRLQRRIPYTPGSLI